MEGSSPVWPRRCRGAPGGRIPSSPVDVTHEAQAPARGFPGRGADDGRRGHPGTAHSLPPDQARDRDHGGGRGDLPEMEPGRPPGQLRRAQGPARGDGPVSDDPGRAKTVPPRGEHRARAGRPAPPSLWPAALLRQPIPDRPPRPEPSARRPGLGRARGLTADAVCPTTSTISASARWGSPASSSAMPG